MKTEKLHMGETYENDRNEKGTWMGSTCWAVKNAEGKVVTIGNNVEMLYNTKTVAIEAMNGLING